LDAEQVEPEVPAEDAVSQSSNAAEVEIQPVGEQSSESGIESAQHEGLPLEIEPVSEVVAGKYAVNVDAEQTEPEVSAEDEFSRSSNAAEVKLQPSGEQSSESGMESVSFGPVVAACASLQKQTAHQGTTDMTGRADEQRVQQLPSMKVVGKGHERTIEQKPLDAREKEQSMDLQRKIKSLSRKIKRAEMIQVPPCSPDMRGGTGKISERSTLRVGEKSAAKDIERRIQALVKKMKGGEMTDAELCKLFKDLQELRSILAAPAGCTPAP